VVLTAKFTNIFMQHRFDFREVFLEKMGNGKLQDLGLEQRANREELFDIVWR